MKAFAIAMALAVVASPALAGKSSHHKHRHARAAAVEAQPFAGAPFAGGTWAQPSGYDAMARAPRAREGAAGQGAYAEMVQRHAAANGVPVSLVHRVIMRESKYNPRAVSKGNYGMMQIRLGTARAMGYTGGAAGLLDPEVNMTYAVKYLAGAYKVAGGNESAAVGHYARGYYYAAKRQGVSPYAAPAASAGFAAPAAAGAGITQKLADRNAVF